MKNIHISIGFLYFYLTSTNAQWRIRQQTNFRQNNFNESNLTAEHHKSPNTGYQLQNTQEQNRFTRKYIPIKLTELQHNIRSREDRIETESPTQDQFERRGLEQDKNIVQFANGIRRQEGLQNIKNNQGSSLNESKRALLPSQSGLNRNQEKEQTRLLDQNGEGRTIGIKLFGGTMPSLKQNQPSQHQERNHFSTRNETSAGVEEVTYGGFTKSQETSDRPKDGGPGSNEGFIGTSNKQAGISLSQEQSRQFQRLNRSDTNNERTGEWQLGGFQSSIYPEQQQPARGRFCSSANEGHGGIGRGLIEETVTQTTELHKTEEHTSGNNISYEKGIIREPNITMSSERRPKIENIQPAEQRVANRQTVPPNFSIFPQRVVSNSGPITPQRNFINQNSVFVGQHPSLQLTGDRMPQILSPIECAVVSNLNMGQTNIRRIPSTPKEERDQRNNFDGLRTNNVPSFTPGSFSVQHPGTNISVQPETPRGMFGSFGRNSLQGTRHLSQTSANDIFEPLDLSMLGLGQNSMFEYRNGFGLPRVESDQLKKQRKEDDNRARPYDQNFRSTSNAYDESARQLPPLRQNINMSNLSRK